MSTIMAQITSFGKIFKKNPDLVKQYIQWHISIADKLVKK
jgi:hypothetical protein